MIEKSITIDFFKACREVIEITQYDADGVIFHLTLTGGSKPIDLTGCDVVFYAKKPDGNIVYNNCVVTSATSGKADYKVTGQTAAAAGDLKCYIVITKIGPITIRSQEFIVTVKPSEDDSGAIESTSEYTDLTAAIAGIANMVTFSGASADGNIPKYSGTGGNVITDSGKLLPAGDIVGTSDIQTLTNKTITSPLIQGVCDGWIFANAAWTYVSPTSFTEPGDKTKKYGKGDPLMWTQNGTIRYSNIAAVPTYDSGTDKTTIAIHSGYISALGDCAILNTSTYPITNNYYSHNENPIGFPDWFNWTPTYSAYGSMTYTSTTTSIARFKVMRKSVFFNLSCAGTTGGTASTAIYFTVPIASVLNYAVFSTFIKDSSYMVGYCALFGSTTLASVGRMDNTVFSLGSDRSIKASGFYEI